MNSKIMQLLNVGVLILITVVVTKLIKKWSHKAPPPSSRKRLPPVVKGWLPLLGGVLRFVKHPMKMLKEEYEKLGSVFTLNLMNKNITFLLEPQVSAHFFTAPESQLSQKEVYAFSVPIFGPGIFYDADYATRMEQFRFFEEAFRVNKLRCFVDYMRQEIQDYFSKWEDNGEVDLKQELENVIILIASRCFLGKEIRDSLSEEIMFLVNELNMAMVPLTNILPYLPIPPHRRRDKARKKLDAIFSKVIASRKSSTTKPAIDNNDMLQSLVDSKYKDGRATTVEEVTGMLITSLYGGQRSGSATSIWTGAYLMHYKKYWCSALEEQRQLMKKYGDNLLTYDVLSEMQVLHGCVKEALRLKPPLALLLRQNHSDFRVETRKGESYDIPSGHIIAVSPALSNRLPYIFKDPDSFDPDRFGIGREEHKLGGPFSFLSFGGGRHSCLGEIFAYLEVKSIWSYLLRNFELELISSFPQTEWNDIVWTAKGKVMVRYKRQILALD